MKLLHIDSSIFGQTSVSRELSALVVKKFQSHHSNIDILRLDLVQTPIGHMTIAHLPQSEVLKDEHKKSDWLAQSEQAYLSDFLSADVIVIGAPMYNFGIPSHLKAWIDRLAIAGITFQYNEKGPIGLCNGKKVIIASTRGGVFSENSPIAFLDHQETYLKAVFSFLGIADITIIRAEGLASIRDIAINNAKEQIASMQM